jgi:hypothetical protein
LLQQNIHFYIKDKYTDLQNKFIVFIKLYRNSISRIGGRGGCDVCHGVEVRGDGDCDACRGVEVRGGDRDGVLCWSNADLYGAHDPHGAHRYDDDPFFLNFSEIMSNEWPTDFTYEAAASGFLSYTLDFYLINVESLIRNVFVLI